MPAVDVTGLAPPIQKMLRALSTPYNQQDVELLREASTHDMVKLYSAMAGGMSADDLWVELRGSLKKRLGEDFGKAALKTYDKIEVTLAYKGEPLGIVTESHGRHLVVTSTEPGSPAERAGITRGHVLKVVGGNTTKTNVDLTNAVNNLHSSGGMSLVVEVKNSLYKLKDPVPEPEPEIESPPSPEEEEVEVEVEEEHIPQEPEADAASTKEGEREQEEEEEEEAEAEEEQQPEPQPEENAAHPEPSHEDPAVKKKVEIQIIRPITEKIKEEEDATDDQPTQDTTAPPQEEDETAAAEEEAKASADETEPGLPKEKKSKKDKKSKKRSRENQREDDIPQEEEDNLQEGDLETSESPTGGKKEKRKKDKKKKKKKEKQKYKLVPQTDPFGNTFELRVPLSESEEDQSPIEDPLSREPTDEHPLSVAIEEEDGLIEESATPTTTTTTTTVTKRKKNKPAIASNEPGGIEMRGPGEAEPEPETEQPDEGNATPVDAPLALGEDGEVTTTTEPRITVSKRKKKKRTPITDEDEAALATHSNIEMEDNNDKESENDCGVQSTSDACEEPEAEEPNLEENNSPENFDPLQGPLPQNPEERSEGSVGEQEQRFHDQNTANNSFFELDNNASTAVEGSAAKTVFTITDVESVSVPEYATRNDVTVFSVTIVSKDFTRKIWRRYTAFSDLKNCYSQLWKRLPPFPKKHLLGLNQQKLEARRVQLGIYLSALVSIIQKATHSVARPLEAFLELNNYKLTQSALAKTQIIGSNESFGENGV